MRYFTVIIVICFSNLLYCQEDSALKIKSNLFSASLLHNTRLSENLVLQKGVSIIKNADFNTLNVPLILRHELTDDWGVYFGSQVSTITNSNNLLLPTDSFNQSDVSLIFGTDYRFKNNVLGSFSIQYRIKQIDNNGIRTPVIQQQPFKFNLGVKF